VEIVVARTFNLLYIYLDLIWLFCYGFLLLYFKRKKAFFTGVLAGILYFIVDYGVFYLALKTRSVEGANTFRFLLWLSFSYGFTNFSWIWLLLDRDKKSIEWSLLVLGGWITIALLSQNFAGGNGTVSISRGTQSYHGVMALIMLIGYLVLIIESLKSGGSERDRISFLRLLAIGIGVQFSWEFILLISGIRPLGIQPLLVNSLIETNLGIPYMFLIHRAITRKAQAVSPR
jgi:hypothetical protein